MKRIPFLHRLYKEEKLQLVEPNDDVKTAYLQKSAKSLSSAKALLGIGNLEDSVSMAYYAMYHALLALLFCIGTAEDFIAQLKDFIDKLTHEKTKNYHNVAEKLIKDESMFGIAKDAKSFVRDKTMRNFS